MKGIIGRKIGMTSIFNEDGTNTPCTIIEAGPCSVTQIKTQDDDGYSAVQLGFEDRNVKKTPQPLQGHFKRAGVEPKKKLVEFRDFDLDVDLGSTISLDIFSVGDLVSVVGTSKGKGFQGVVKRHGFHGVGGRTHGQHNRERAPGSVGASSTPSRVFKGMKMAGRTGNQRVKVKDMFIVKLLPERNMLLVDGSVPGAKGSYLIIEK